MKKNTLLSFLTITLIAAGLSVWWGKVHAAGTATLSLLPASGSPAVNSTFNVTVYENSGVEAVNTVDAELSYDPAKLQYVSYDGSGSAFDNSGPSSGGGGKVSIARFKAGGATVTGSQVVAVVTFKALAGSGSSAISFASSSGIVKQSDYTNIWNGSTTGGTYSFSTPTPPPVPTPTPAPNPSVHPTTPTPTPAPSPTSKPGPAPSPTPTPATTSNPFVSPTAGVTYFVAIKVVDDQGKAVVGAKVTMEGLPSTVSDTTGIASFTGVQDGLHAVTVQPSGKAAPTRSRIVVKASPSPLAVQQFQVKLAAAQTIPWSNLLAVFLVIMLIGGGFGLWSKWRSRVGHPSSANPVFSAASESSASSPTYPPAAAPSQPPVMKPSLMVSKLPAASIVVCAVLAAAAGILILRKGHAESFCDIAPANTNVAIDAAIKSCADGSTIRFPANASYSLPDTIFVKDRHDLVIDGQGSTFTITTQGNTKPALPWSTNGSKNGGNWMLLRGTNITLKNMHAIGSFPLAGQPRDLGKEGSEPGYAEWMSNYGLYGVNGAYLQDLTGKGPWGDVITSAPDTYVDNYSATPNYASNIYIKRVHAESTSRMCYGLTSGNNMWLEDSYCKDAWYGGSDEELDNQQQPMVGLHILRNSFDGFNLFGFAVPVPGPNVRDIEIKNNVFVTSPDKPCNATITIGIYPNNPDTDHNVVVDNNTMMHAGLTIALDHIIGGSIQNNKLIQAPDPGCGTAAGPAAPITTTNSSNITIANNGPDAPGAGGTVTPPPPTPAPTPPPPAPTPTPPPVSSCSAPANFAAAPGPAGSGRYDFTWSATSGASEYNLYFAIAPGQPSALYSGPFNATSGSAFGLSSGRQYSFAIRAKCSVESANSNVLTVSAPGSTTPSPTPTPTPPPPTPVPGDISGDGHVDFIDLSILASSYGKPGHFTAAQGDLNGDGVVNVIDLSILASNWGK